MRRLQLGTSQEGQSQLSPHRPSGERLLLAEGTEEDEDEQSGNIYNLTNANAHRYHLKNPIWFSALTVNVS